MHTLHCLWIVLLSTFLLTKGSLSHPAAIYNTSQWDYGTPLQHEPKIPEHEPIRRSLQGGRQLRILPLGASIVFGYASADGNGFRYGLRNALVYNGNAVNMVGSVKGGTMADNDVEGWPGALIDYVANKAELSIPSQPNIVLLHCGTNDMTQNFEVATAYQRLDTLIARLFDAIPGTTVIVSTLLPNGIAGAEANIAIYNAGIRNIVTSRQEQGQKIILADMHSGFFSMADIQTGDLTHPTAAGYQKMAAVWYQAIQAAAAQNWISPVIPVIGVSDSVTKASSTCEKTTTNAIGPVLTQQGGVELFTDGPYIHTGILQADIEIEATDSNPLGVFFADMNGDGIDDYIHIGPLLQNGYSIALNSGNGKFAYPTHFPSPDMSCALEGIRFIKFVGTARSDLCCIGPTGIMVCWQNTAGPDPVNPKWVALGTVFGNEGYALADIILGDIDGDGRTDYLAMGADGSVTAWRNGAVGVGPPQYWSPLGVVFKATGYSTQFRMADLNGDGRDDMLLVNEDGQVFTWINQRGFSLGLAPAWVSMGLTHYGGAELRNITFGRIWGSNKPDYIWVTPIIAGMTLTSWKNEDVGGTQLKGDGCRYCDMTGSGSDDYVWIGPNGEIVIYENVHNPPHWNDQKLVYTVGHIRKEIYLAKFSNSKRCDILIVDRKTGSTSMIRNDYANGVWKFTPVGVVSGTATCTEGYGPGLLDLGVRFADMDGDGLADYLCMSQDGTTRGYWNRGLNNLVNAGQIKKSEGKERASLRYADIDGDGLADLLWLSQDAGEMIAWTNGGLIPTAGSSNFWVIRGEVAVGNSARGQCINFGNIYGLGRADYIIVQPLTGIANTYFNVCPGVGSVTPTVPDLPVVPNPPGSVTSSNFYVYDFPDYDSSTFCDRINSIIQGVDDEPAGQIDLLEDAWNIAHAQEALDYTASRMSAGDWKQGIDYYIGSYQHTGQTGCQNEASLTCTFPQQCPSDGSNIPYYYIERSFANYHDIQHQFAVAFSDQTLVTVLNITNIMNDFTSLDIIRDPVGSLGMLGMFGSVLSITSSALSLVPGVGTFLGGAGGALGGILSTLGSTEPSHSDNFLANVAVSIETRLATTISGAVQGILAAGAAVFHTYNLTGFPASALAVDGTREWEYGIPTTDIGKFFANGKFLLSLEDFNIPLNIVGSYLDHAIILTVLQASNAYVYRDGYDASGCDTNGGYVMSLDDAGDRCYTLEVPGIGEQSSDFEPDGGREQLSQPLSADLLDTMASTYGISIQDVISVSFSCQTAKGDYGGQFDFKDLNPTGTASGNLYSQCFWNLPVLLGNTIPPPVTGLIPNSPCNMASWYTGKTAKSDGGTLGVDYLPAWLDTFFNPSFCYREIIDGLKV